MTWSVRDPARWEDYPNNRFTRVLHRHCHTAFRLLRRQVGRSWSEVQPELEAHCRRIAAPEYVRKAVREAVFVQIGLRDRRQCLCLPSDLYIDEESGRLCRR